MDVDAAATDLAHCNLITVPNILIDGQLQDEHLHRVIVLNEHGPASQSRIDIGSQISALRLVQAKVGGVDATFWTVFAQHVPESLLDLHLTFCWFGRPADLVKLLRRLQSLRSFHLTCTDTRGSNTAWREVMGAIPLSVEHLTLFVDAKVSVFDGIALLPLLSTLIADRSCLASMKFLDTLPQSLRHVQLFF
ncbi:hypothetical protein AMAG_20766 [Allomyces macrogynus ATCC 38327]|uniref:Uncharacterized protein n=1 Tax=Allomyces macrogynus (strain ATCC 38327) TaxID=578462 RepID=A0A0L0TF87_ALLM3|nr:hypothetical protein AMAG_20766 [Allomyces macrogynus ATCC 38327]|eukprot:KNE73331.1 hypothetical protein AMAG_20766 [Allomyces macrogynus ATCC 38327]